MSPEVMGRLSILRQKLLDGTATTEDLRESVALMREDRKAGPPPTVSASSRKKMAKAVVQSADEMLDELGK